jgi:hypothetical protein
VILNHNPADPKSPGDVSLFVSVDALVRELRTADLVEGSYFAVDSTGRVVTMSPTGDDGDDAIEATAAAHASEAQLAKRMIKHFLLSELEEDSDHAPDAKRRHLIEREHNMEHLIDLIPEDAIEGT